MRIGLMIMKKRLLLLLKSLPLVLFVTFVWFNFKTSLDTSLDDDPGGHVFFENATAPLPFSLDALSDVINDQNRKQRILNWNKFGSIEPNESIIVIQVHNRAQYLSALIDSLSTTVGIEKSLLIFSHDIYDLNINAIVTNITFTRVSCNITLDTFIVTNHNISGLTNILSVLAPITP